MTFVNSTKTPSDDNLLGRTSRSFLWCWLLLLLFFSLEVFTFPGYFFLQPALHPDFLGSWRPPPALSSTLATFFCFTFVRFFYFLVSATVLSVHFLPTSVFFTLYSFPTFLARFVTQMLPGTLHPESSFVPALTELPLPADAWTWTTYIVVRRRLIYWLRQWATKYRVKIKLLNMCCLSKVILKDYKNTLKKAW